MSEVDDNLNYMLGQLSLVVSEFNQVGLLIKSILCLIKKYFLRLKLVLGKPWRASERISLKNTRIVEMQRSRIL